MIEKAKIPNHAIPRPTNSIKSIKRLIQIYKFYTARGPSSTAIISLQSNFTLPRPHIHFAISNFHSIKVTQLPMAVKLQTERHRQPRRTNFPKRICTPIKHQRSLQSGSNCTNGYIRKLFLRKIKGAD